MTNKDFGVSLLAGGAAGTAVDVSLFPLDTIKTRLQSEAGFLRSGGFRGIYSGLPTVIVGSAPTAALFFCTYEGIKSVFDQMLNHNSKWSPMIHMSAAGCGEVAACLIRVPVEVVKQRAQASQIHSSMSVLKATLKSEGFAGLFRGYFSTVFREIPFSVIQFPLWEYTKKCWSERQQKPVDPWQSAICGSVAGCVASGITTPLDVAKTRIMLAETGSSLAKGNIVFAMKVVYKQNGVKGLFAGIVPRMTWISIGGAIFLGVYDKMKLTFKNIFKKAEYS